MVFAQGDNTPLHWASMRGHVEIVRLLCERSADRSIRNKQDKVGSSGAMLTPRRAVCCHESLCAGVFSVCAGFVHGADGFRALGAGARGPGAALLVALLPVHEGGVGQLGGTAPVMDGDLLADFAVQA